MARALLLLVGVTFAAGVLAVTTFCDLGDVVFVPLVVSAVLAACWGAYVTHRSGPLAAAVAALAVGVATCTAAVLAIYLVVWVFDPCPPTG